MTENAADTPGDDRGWWYCLKHDRVEFGAGCANKHRLGPYAGEREAALALQTVAERNERWEEADKRWEEGEES